MDASSGSRPGVDAVSDASGALASDTGELATLAEALESADELALEDRLALLQQAEAAIARALEGLDGL